MSKSTFYRHISELAIDANSFKRAAAPVAVVRSNGSRFKAKGPLAVEDDCYVRRKADAELEQVLSGGRAFAFLSSNFRSERDRFATGKTSLLRRAPKPTPSAVVCSVNLTRFTKNHRKNLHEELAKVLGSQTDSGNLEHLVRRIGDNGCLLQLDEFGTLHEASALLEVMTMLDSLHDLCERVRLHVVACAPSPLGELLQKLPQRDVNPRWEKQWTAVRLEPFTRVEVNELFELLEPARRDQARVVVDEVVERSRGVPARVQHFCINVERGAKGGDVRGLAASELAYTEELP
jgi:hypothetical protein